jgi:FkbH-like protein
MAALAELDPMAAAGWLRSMAAWVQVNWSPDLISRLLGVVIDRVAHTSTVSEAGELTQLVRDYGEYVSAAAVARLAAWGPARHHLTELKEIIDQALRRNANHASLLRAATDIAIEIGDHVEADRLLTRLARADRSQASMRQVRLKRASLSPSGDPPVRVAFLSSYTIDPLVDYLDAECRALGLSPRFYVTPFNSWAQEVIAEESGLHEFSPEIAFLSLSIDDLIPELVAPVAEDTLREAGAAALDRVLAVLRRLSEWSDGIAVVHGFHSVYPDPNGLLAGRRGLSRSTWLADLNARLNEETRAIERAYFLDISDVLLRRSGDALDNPKVRHLAAMRLSGPILADLALAYANYIAPLKGLTRKCVVVDLDNTLWGGIVGEDGPHGIKLGVTSPGSEYREFQQHLLSLTERGLLLAINSKNNPEDALEVIRSHEAMVLREESFAAMRINWLPKPENMLAIAQELNIGVDSLVFLDDNPNERELMRQALPEVLTPELPSDPSLYRATVEMIPQLQKLVVTEEDLTRTRLYLAKRKREETRVTSTSLGDYLASLDIRVTIGRADDSTLPRVHQLFERTNQFNLTTRRYSAGELGTAATDPACRLYVLRAADRFGDHGLVATALVRIAPKRWTVDSFLMSCRVIGYGVESALLGVIADDAKVFGATELAGEYIPTPKNVPAKDFYPRHGFSEQQTEGGATLWLTEVDELGFASPQWIRTELMHDT